MARLPIQATAPRHANIFDELLEKGMRAGIIPERTAMARAWYRQAAGQVRTVDENQLMSSDPARFRQRVEIGRMYMFYYDPKLKKELPYYDQFPLVFPLEVYGDRFLALNMHYLSPRLRAKLMDALWPLVTSKNKLDASTTINMTYRLLASVQALRYYKPAIKMYLKNHLRSRFVAVAASEWSIALYLPTERFLKATRQRVWADSEAIVRRGRPINPLRKKAKR